MSSANQDKIIKLFNEMKKNFSENVGEINKLAKALGGEDHSKLFGAIGSLMKIYIIGNEIVEKGLIKEDKERTGDKFKNAIEDFEKKLLINKNKEGLS
jgi:hypothetical protein